MPQYVLNKHNILIWMVIAKSMNSECYEHAFWTDYETLVADWMQHYSFGYTLTFNQYIIPITDNQHKIMLCCGLSLLKLLCIDTQPLILLPAAAVWSIQRL